jgi:indolepyruvate ferredoxin oxidoreductase beta subunit
MIFQIFLAGVGGQGILSITDILCNAAVEMGFSVRGSETHGMSQRGGSVFSNVRFGDVYSPLIMERAADILIGFEPTEALRYAEFIKPDGFTLVNNHSIPSPNFVLSKSSYPPVELFLQRHFGSICKKIISFNATKHAIKLGNPIIQNIIMLGALSAIPQLPLRNDVLKQALKKQFKEKFFPLNLEAYELGRKLLLTKI